MGLEEARDIGRQWHDAIRAGLDPGVAVEPPGEAPQPGSFASAAERFLKKIAGQRQAADAGRYVKRLVKMWGVKRLDEITRADVVKLLPPSAMT